LVITGGWSKYQYLTWMPQPGIDSIPHFHFIHISEILKGHYLVNNWSGVIQFMKNIVFLFIFLFYSSSFISATFYEVDILDELDKIENDIIYSYEIIIDVEKENANVDELIDELNEAVNLLNDVKIDLKNGKIDDARLTLKTCQSISSDVMKELDVIYRDINEINDVRTNNLTFLIRLINLSLIVLFMLIWVIFRRHYINTLLNKKPMVNDDDIK